MPSDQTFESSEVETGFDPNAEQQELEAQPEMESEAQTSAVTVAPPPTTNGHVPAGPTVQLQETITHPPRAYVAPVAPIHRRPAPRAIKPDRNQNARAKVDAMCILPESMDWELRIHRLPQGMTLSNGETVKTGFLEAFDLMPFDNLRDAIGRLWGGGEYRVVPCSKNGHAPITNVTEAQVAFVSIPPEDYPPKNSRGAAPEIEPDAVEEEDGEVQQVRKNNRLALEQMRADETEHKIKKRRMQLKIEELTLQKQEQDLLGTTKKEDNSLEFKLILSEMRQAQEKVADEIRRQQKEDREIAERRAKEDRDAAERREKENRDAMMALMSKLGDQIAKIADKPAPMPLAPVDKTPELITAMGTMLAAIAPKQDTSQLQIAQMSQQQNERMFELAAKLTARENQQQAALMSELIKGRVGENKQSSMQEIISILEYGRKLTDHNFKLAQGSADEPAPGEGWNPKIGVVGNIAQGFFGIIKEAVKSAASSPQAQQLLLNLFNKTNPSDTEAMAAAQELERQQIAQGRQPQQLPMAGMPQVGVQGQPAPQFPQVPGMNIPMRQNPQPPAQRPPQQRQPQQPVQQRVPPGPQTRPAAAPAPQAPAAPATAPANGAAPAEVKPPEAPVAKVDPEEAAAKAAADLNAEVTGVSDVDVTKMGEQPQPAAAEAPPAPASEAPQIQPQQAAQQPQPPVDESVERLRERVTEAMEMALENVKDEIEAHDWPEFAIAKWNGRFKAFLVQQVDDQHRVGVIAHYCDPQVWATLNQTLSTCTAEPPQWNCFFEGVRAVIAPRS